MNVSLALRWAVTLSIFLLLGGCFRVALPTFPHRLEIRQQSAGKGMFIHFYPKDQRVISDVVSSVQQATKVTELWGMMKAPVHIHVFPNHRSLEEAISRSYPWLRAWAMYDKIYLQSPRTWRYRYYQLPLRELLTHELTHVVMYQLCCDPNKWHKQPLPLWFREGMATVTANERQYNWPWKKMRAFVQTKRGQDVLANPDDFLKTQQPLVYALGHWMFAVLVETWKTKGIRDMMAHMKRGMTFGQAFKKVTGMSVNTFKIAFVQRAKEKKKPLKKALLSHHRVTSPHRIAHKCTVPPTSNH